MPEPADRRRTKRTLYDVLAVAARAGVSRGETEHTAEKETVDRDRENDLAALLLERT